MLPVCYATNRPRTTTRRHTTCCRACTRSPRTRPPCSRRPCSRHPRWLCPRRQSLSRTPGRRPCSCNRGCGPTADLGPGCSVLRSVGSQLVSSISSRTLLRGEHGYLLCPRSPKKLLHA